MNQAIIDIGSNTMVLEIFKQSEKNYVSIHHQSTPTQLIQNIKDGNMTLEAMDLLKSTLESYLLSINEFAPCKTMVLVTEPHRNLQDTKQLTDIFMDFHIPYLLLTGKQEAYFSYFAARNTHPNIKEGYVFDLGGGSSEIVQYQDEIVNEFVSIPMGCVKRMNYPIEESVFTALIQNDLPRLKNKEFHSMIGIGGTCKALQKLYVCIYGRTQHLAYDKIKELSEKLIRFDEKVMNIAKEIMDENRLKTLRYGTTIILEILTSFSIDEFYVSDGGVRIGYLLSQNKKGL